MAGIDIHLSVGVAPATVRRALAEALEVPRDALEVVASWEDLGGSTGFSCRVVRRAGDFPTSIEVGSVERALDTKRLTKALAKALGCECLISDDSLNPYSWILVSRDGGMRTVAVDPEELDRDELVLTDETGGDTR